MTALPRWVVWSVMLGVFVPGSAQAGFIFVNGGATFQAFSPLDSYTPPPSPTFDDVHSQLEFRGTFSSSPSLTGSVRAVGGGLGGANSGGSFQEMFLSISGVGAYNPGFRIISFTIHTVTGNPALTMTMSNDVSGYLAPGDTAYITIIGYARIGNSPAFEHSFGVVINQPGEFSQHLFWESFLGHVGTLGTSLAVSGEVTVSIDRRNTTGEESIVNVDPGVFVEEFGGSAVPAPSALALLLSGALGVALSCTFKRVLAKSMRQGSASAAD